ncbi:type II secretion system secretin GspD [Methylobacterium sp. WSM2598]|uniref:type II secretion system secretin GspD n=1 Tax=Methylobacterium sp. WSM2598 TaxID=398261 RepID=UPI0003672B03|nr:type II secretion system secretin GspD [Methylobacterium sp. WSM2598]
MIAGLLGFVGPLRSQEAGRATLAGPELNLDLTARATPPVGAKAGREGGLVPRDRAPGRSYHFPPEPIETTGGLPVDLGEPLDVGNAATGEGSFRLNFERAEIKDVLHTVLNETLGLSYTLGADVAGQVTISSPRPLTRAEMLGAIESVLASHGLALTRNGSGYLIAPTALGSGSVNFGSGAQAGYGVSVVPLRHVSAAVMSRLVSGFVTEADGVRFDISRNTIVLKGPGPKRQEAVSAILSLDGDWMRGQSVSLFELRRVRPEAVVAELAQLFDTSENGAGSGLIQFKPVSRLRAVLVLSKNPALIRRAETFIRKLDNVTEAAEENVFVYKARYRDARELARVVNGLFGNGQGGLAAGPTGPGLGQQGRSGLGGAGSSGQGGLGSGFGGGGLSSPGGSGLPASQPGGNGNELLRARFASAFGDAVPAAPADPGGGMGGGMGGGLAGGGMNSAMIDLTTQPNGRGRGVAISADPANNAVVTYADGDTYKKVYAALRRLDAVPAQVAVNVTIAEVKLNDELKHGVQFFLDSRSLGLGRNKGSVGLVSAAASGASNVLKPGNGFNFLVGGYSGPDVVINALDGFTDVKVLSSPSLVVLENQPATLQVGDSVPITTRQAQSVDFANAPLINQVEFRDTGIILNVIPRIGQNDAVTMQIEQEISAVVGGSDTLTPTISKRRVASTISVANGQTVLLAGLISDKHQRERDGIPILGRLPQIGALFSSTNNADERTELVVFIRPVVVRSGRDAQRVAEDYRGQLLDAGVRRGARAAAPVLKR